MNTECKHGVNLRYDCEYCRKGIEPYNCKHGIDSQLGCPDCTKELLNNSIVTSEVTEIKARTVLLTYQQKNKCFLSSNELHTCTNAMENYVELKTKSKDQQIKDLTEKLEQARSREILAFYWGQDSPYYEFSHYENSEDYLQPKP